MTRGVVNFVGSRLEEARLARGLTQTSLAQLVERNSSSVSGWESGRQSPDWPTLERLSAVLNVRPPLFCQGLSDEERFKFYRSTASVTVGLQKKAQARLRWAEIAFNALHEWVEFPTVYLPDCRFDSILEIDEAAVELAAAECREFYGLGRGPVGNVISAIEGAGCIVVREELGGVKMDGLTMVGRTDSRPYIFLASDKASAARSRFDAAHELGHLILHRNVDPQKLNSAEYAEMEMQAHRFASAFLLPEDSFARDVRGLDLDSFASMKPKWNVSIAAMIMRCTQLEMISDEYKQRLFIYMSQRKWRKCEPLDETTAPEVPSSLREAIQLVIESGKYSRETLLDLIGLNPADVESLAALPPAYMRREAAPVVRLRE